MGLGGLSRLGKFDVCTASQKTDSINKIDIIKFANIRNDVATFAATKAMPGLRNRINLARRRFSPDGKGNNTKSPSPSDALPNAQQKARPSR